MQHSPGFLKLVEDALTRVSEISLEEVKETLKNDSKAQLIDVREESEWRAGHAIEAEHLGKGIFERDLESRYPDKNQKLILYCGGGYRSALSADAARAMGYTNALSLAGGYKAMVAAGWEMEKAESGD